MPKGTESMKAIAKKSQPSTISATKAQSNLSGKSTGNPTARNRVAKRQFERASGASHCENDCSEDVEPVAKRQRKAKEGKTADNMPLAARTAGHVLYIGAHVSSAGGVHNSVANAKYIGANAFALFLKSQRKWSNPPLTDEHSMNFHSSCTESLYEQGSHVVPHGSYLVNLAHTDLARSEQAYSSYIDDIKRCERLGIRLYNIHPGNMASSSREKAIEHLAGNINRAHAETSTVITLLENMAASGNTLGGMFEDLRDIISHVIDRTRIGVCFDTCHAFAAGYDLRSTEAFKDTMDKFESTIGFEYLKALHLNDSKAPLGSHRDLHANIGTGFLGLRAFHHILNDARFAGLPLILETPIEVRDTNGQLVKNAKGKVIEDKGIWASEIKMLESLVGMDIESADFAKLEQALSMKGEPERRRMAGQFERKLKNAAKMSAKAERGKKKKESEMEE